MRFDKLFLYFMDRFVWLIAITVISNLIIDISTVTASDKDSSTTDNKADTKIHIEETEQVEKIEPLVPLRTDKDPIPNGRNQLLDNIFNIPIVTLRAVNDLVQSIAGNLQAAGSGTYFNNQRSRNEKEYKVIMMTQSPATASGGEEHTERIDI